MKQGQTALPLTGDFHVVPGFRNSRGITTNWKLLDRKGNRLATLTTKTDAVRIAGILSRAYAILKQGEANG